MCWIVNERYIYKKNNNKVSISKMNQTIEDKKDKVNSPTSPWATVKPFNVTFRSLESLDFTSILTIYKLLPPSR